MQIELYPRVVVDSEILSGKPIIAGTHTPVSALIQAVAAGNSLADVAHEHGLSPDEVRAAHEYAATRTDEAIAVPVMPPSDTSSAQTLADQLAALRAQIVASGEPLLSWEGVAAVAEQCMVP